ncbi:ankyrin repeat-containing domain protein [Mycena sanguinolenta]|nr:ankyrin repeat-containing domain protein [Mycena sanguinolenta]
MAVLADLPPELILRIVSLFMTREILLPDLDHPAKLALVPDLPSINAVSRTNAIFHRTLNRTLYKLCATVKRLGELAVLFSVQNELENAVDKLVAAGVCINAEFRFINDQRCGLLYIAAASGLRDMVAKLLGMYGKDVVARMHARDGNGKTALDYAASDEDLVMVMLLAPLSCGGNNDIPPTISDDHKRYLGHALVESVSAGHLQISRYLISVGGDVNFKQPLLPTPLYQATGTENLELVQFLLDAGANPNLEEPGMIPLHYAAELGDIEIIQALLAAGADMNAEDDESGTVLAYIADADVLRFFLSRGVDPNHEDDAGQTMMDYACSMGDGKLGKALVEVLLEFGATAVEKVDSQGETAVDIALRMGHSEIVQLLEPLVQDPDLKLKIELCQWWDENIGCGV